MNIFLAELIGTMLLVLLGNGAVATVLLGKSKGQHGGWIVITAGWGFAVAIAVYVTGWISGGHLNPAVTLGFCLAKKTAWSLFWTYISGQLIGGFIGSLSSFLPIIPTGKKLLILTLNYCALQHILRSALIFGTVSVK
jgi:glycerol uptake facilitator protein